MKETILQNLSAVIRALDTITVSGKQNLANLSGSISVLENMAAALAQCDITQPEADKPE